MAYDIGPRISIKGEKEFNNQMNSINQQLKELGSEMKAVTTEFSENADSQQALISKSRLLNQQLDAQKQKYDLLDTAISQHSQILEGLRADYQRVSQESGTTSSEAIKLENAIRREEGTISKLRTSLNETQAYMNKLGTEIGQTDTKLSEIEAGTRDAATGISKLGDEAKEADNDLEGLGNAAKSVAFSELAEGLSGAAQSMSAFAEESKETLTIMGQLDTASKNAGYTTKQTQETFNQLNGVLGDTQTAATTTSNLQALGLEQSKLTRLTEGAIGAWTKYGDSIPIDSLAEAINETAQTGTVTGTFADVLNWAGTSEDAFNQKLQSTTSVSERANMIMQELANQGLMESAKGFRENNSELIAYNEASGKFDQAMSNLATIVMPALSAVMEVVAAALQKVVGFFQSLPGPVQQAVTVFGAIVGIAAVLAPIILTVASAVSLLNVSLLPIIGVIAAVAAAIAIIVVVVKNWGSIVTWFKNLWNTAWTAIKSVFDSIVEAIKTGFNTFAKFVKTIWNGIKTTITTVVNGIKTVVLTVWNAIKTGITTVINGIKTVITSVWNGIKTIVTTVTGTIKNGAVNGFRTMVNGIRNVVGKIGGVIKNGFNAAIKFITGLPSKALQWGKDFVQGIIDGIKAMIGKVADAAKSIADKIANFLHFSRPDEGPLREYEKWMPDFMTGLANGIYENIKKVQNAAAAVATTIDSTFTNDVNGIIKGASVSNTSIMMIDGDTITLDGKAIGKSATKYITTTQAAAMASKGRRV